MKNKLISSLIIGLAFCNAQAMHLDKGTTAHDASKAVLTTEQEAKILTAIQNTIQREAIDQRRVEERFKADQNLTPSQKQELVKQAINDYSKFTPSQKVALTISVQAGFLTLPSDKKNDVIDAIQNCGNLTGYQKARLLADIDPSTFKFSVSDFDPALTPPTTLKGLLDAYLGGIYWKYTTNEINAFKHSAIQDTKDASLQIEERFKADQNLTSSQKQELVEQAINDYSKFTPSQKVALTISVVQAGFLTLPSDKKNKVIEAILNCRNLTGYQKARLLADIDPSTFKFDPA